MSDRIRTAPDVAFRPAGVGMSTARHCMGCKTPKSQIGSAGLGVRWRCAGGLAAKAARKAVTA